VLACDVEHMDLRHYTPTCISANADNAGVCSGTTTHADTEERCRLCAVETTFRHSQVAGTARGLDTVRLIRMREGHHVNTPASLVTSAQSWLPEPLCERFPGGLMDHPSSVALCTALAL